MDPPKLTEPGIKYYLNHILINCRSTKDKYYNIMFNLACLLVFIICVGSLLHYKYKGNNNIVERKQKEEQKKKYILEKIRKMQKMNVNNSMDLITNLPLWEKQ